MEQLADTVSWESRRTLAEWEEGRRIRPRHARDGLAAQGEQVPRHQGLRRQACGAHRPTGSRRRGFFQKHQDSPLITVGAPMKKESLDRRDFLKTASAAGVGAFAASRGIGPLFAFGGSPAEKMVVGVMGLNGRGMVHAQDFAHGANTTVAYLCDVDSNVLAKAMAATT